MSVVKEFSGIDVDDMLQLRNKKEKKIKKKIKMDMLLHMCVRSGLAINFFVLTVRPSRRHSVTFLIFSQSGDSLNDKS